MFKSWPNVVAVLMLVALFTIGVYAAQEVRHGTVTIDGRVMPVTVIPSTKTVIVGNTFPMKSITYGNFGTEVSTVTVPTCCHLKTARAPATARDEEIYKTALK